MDGYENLRQGILKLAVKDYKSALKSDNRGKKISLERFFRSEWGQFLSNDMGEEIIKMCRRKVRHDK